MAKRMRNRGPSEFYGELMAVLLMTIINHARHATQNTQLSCTRFYLPETQVEQGMKAFVCTAVDVQWLQ